MSERERKRILPDISAKLLVMYLVWLAAVSAGLLVYVSGNLSSDLLPPERIHLLVVESQLFFLIFIWPLFLSSTSFLETSDVMEDVHEEERTYTLFLSEGWVRFQRFTIHAISLVLFSLPIVLLSASFSGISAVRAIQLQVLVISVIAGSGFIWGLGGSRNRNWIHYFYAVVLFISLVAPVMYVMLVELQGITDKRLLFFSPFTAVTLYDTGSTIPAWLFQTLMFTIGGAGAGLFLFTLRRFFEHRAASDQLPSSAR